MTITLTQAMDTLREVVAEHGKDHVYDRSAIMFGPLAGETCLYVRNGKPDCIVGHVLHRLGVQLDTLHDSEGMGPRDLSLGDSPSLELDDDAGLALTVAQNTQDNGETWGTALANTERHVSNL